MRLYNLDNTRKEILWNLVKISMWKIFKNWCLFERHKDERVCLILESMQIEIATSFDGASYLYVRADLIKFISTNL